MGGSSTGVEAAAWARLRPPPPFDPNHHLNNILVPFSLIWSNLRFLQRVRIAGSAERCNRQRDSAYLSVCPSVRHVPVLCPDEWRYDRAVFSIW